MELTPEQQVSLNMLPSLVMPNSNAFNQTLNNNVILELINPAKTLTELEMDFKGFTYDEHGESKAISEPLLNDIGVASVLIFAKTLINKDNSVSNLNENQIKKLVLSIVKRLNEDLLVHKIKYGIKDNTIKRTIVETISSRSYIFLMRAKDAGERGLIGRTNQNITFNTDGGKAPKGLSSILGLGK